MSDPKERPERNQSDRDDYNESRGGKRDGGTPDYEKSQSAPQDDKDFDNSKSSF